MFVLSTENEKLNSESLLYTEMRNLQLKITKRSPLNAKVNCENFAEKYRHLNCTTRRWCIERCLNRTFVENFRRIYVGTLAFIDKAHLRPEELQLPVTLEHAGYDRFEAECIKQFPDEPECFEVKFEETSRISRVDRGNLNFDLFFNVVRLIEDQPSIYKLILEIVSIFGVFSGLTVFSVLQMIYHFVQTKLKVRENKIVLSLIYLLCSLGFGWHTYQVFNGVVSGDLTRTQHYETLQSIRMPDVIVCLTYNRFVIDPHHKLTGNYLTELTKELYTRRIFRSIRFLDEENQWRWFNLSLIQEFYFTGKKCFLIRIDREYHKRQFFFLESNEVLRINFNLNDTDLLYFESRGIRMPKDAFDLFTKPSNTRMLLSKPVLLDYTYERYSIWQEIFEVGDLFLIESAPNF